jgi:hypothetical protein
MAEGEYDIAGNLIGGSSAVEAATAEPLFKKGDPCEVKEGGTKFRAATVVKFDEGIGAVDVTYTDDGEFECGVPVNLVRKPGAVEPPKQQVRPKQKRAKGSKEVPLPRQCYELVKGFSAAEQVAALQMLQALDSVRMSAAPPQ